MVNQLTEVSSLQQLISINQTLTNLSSGTVPTTTLPTNSTGAITIRRKTCHHFQHRFPV